MKLLTMGKGSPKLIKSDRAKLGYLSAIQYLAPHTISGYNVCRFASKGCASACLFTSGRGACSNVRNARINRTVFFIEKRGEYLAQLCYEIRRFIRKCDKAKQIPAIRLNGTSDISWELTFPELFTEFPNVQWYDYTKHFTRMIKFCMGSLPNNYHLTFSRSECNDDLCLKVLRAGGNVAVVFSDKNLPKKWKRFNVFNADETDLRFLDKKGVAGLYAKGKARYDTSGFVVGVS